MNIDLTGEKFKIGILTYFSDEEVTRQLDGDDLWTELEQHLHYNMLICDASSQTYFTSKDCISETIANHYYGGFDHVERLFLPFEKERILDMSGLVDHIGEYLLADFRNQNCLDSLLLGEYSEPLSDVAQRLPSSLFKNSCDYRRVLNYVTFQNERGFGESYTVEKPLEAAGILASPKNVEEGC